MKNKILSISLFILTAAAIGFYPFFQKNAGANTDANVNIEINTKPKIQLAILLDTSSSMSGLINQTREQLWQVVNEFSKAEQHGKKPVLEVAVYEYGNSRLSSGNGYIRQVTALTGELDAVSEALFSLTTNGGDEYCGYVIKTAVNDLAWSHSDNDIKAIFIAGNEPFTQGPVPFQEAIAYAKNKGITVNTIHAGPIAQGENSGWKAGAVLAGGEFMSIDHNHKVAHFESPQDKKIAELNSKLNSTYVPYGAKGQAKANRQKSQDAESNAVSQGLLVKRAEAKISSLYDNSNWDLVDALESGKVNVEKLDNKVLPDEMRAMSKEKQKAFLQEKVEQRKLIKKQIMELSQERKDFITSQEQEAAKPGVATMNEAMTSAIQKQGEKKNYKFNSK